LILENVLTGPAPRLTARTPGAMLLQPKLMHKLGAKGPMAGFIITVMSLDLAILAGFSAAPIADCILLFKRQI
jgi:hypothetical protein